MCPTISFGENGEGFSSSDISFTQNFKWNLRNETLTVSYDSINNNHIFSNASFLVFISNEEKDYKMTIREKETDVSFYLSRTK